MKLRYWWKWEFWPFWFFYIPVYLYYIYLALLTRSLTFFTAANPGMDFGGFVDYSKNKILANIDPKNLPKTLYVEKTVDSGIICNLLARENIRFPIIVKPDRGERGWMVQKISNENELNEYLSMCPAQLLIQEFIPHRNEYGIMYARIPGQSAGRITSVVIKEQLIVIGDGTATLRELCRKSKRCRYHFTGDQYRSDYGVLRKELARMDQVIPPILISYLRLTPTIKCFGTARNHHFGNVLETTFLLTIEDIDQDKRKQFVETYESVNPDLFK